MLQSGVNPCGIYFSVHLNDISALFLEIHQLLSVLAYLLQFGVLNQTSIPLTKSNRVEESDSLHSRVACWWTLIRRLWSHNNIEVEKRFVEICKPLVEFCLSTSVSSNTLVNGGKWLLLIHPMSEILPKQFQFYVDYESNMIGFFLVFGSNFEFISRK